MTTYNIYPVPGRIHGPPYLDLLYKNTEGQAEDGSIFEIKEFSLSSLLFRLIDKTRKHVVHIHWETNIYGSRYLLVSLVRMFVRFPALWAMKLRGVRIVWTKHNMSAHDYKHQRIDKIGTNQMWHLADTIILQERVFAENEAKRRNSANIVCIPPGNYIGAYGPLWVGNREKMREHFGIRPGETVLLALGSVRPYKALPQIIETIKDARKKGANLHLIIVGKASLEYAEVIKKEAGNDESITLILGYIPDGEISKYLAIADYTICYYLDSALGSAAIMLSLSYGVPVVSRDFPASELIVPGIGGFVFHEKNELIDILLKLPSLARPEPHRIIDTVRAQDWKSAGHKLRKVYKELE